MDGHGTPSHGTGGGPPRKGTTPRERLLAFGPKPYSSRPCVQAEALLASHKVSLLTPVGVGVRL